MSWNINFLEYMEEWLSSLPKEQFISVAKELRLLELCGNQLKLPHSKALGGGLFELRERKFGLRIYYTFAENRLIILLMGGNKSTQSRDIKKAKQLLKAYVGDEAK